MTHPHGGVIWSRPIDEAKLSTRWRKFGLYYGAPMVVALVVALALGGIGALLGVLILLGAFGLLLAALIFFKNINARANRTIQLVDGRLTMGAKHVDLSRLESWTAAASEETWGVIDAGVFGNPTAGNAITARVMFRLAIMDANGRRGVRADGGPAFEVVDFAWAEMSPDELRGVTAALGQHLRAPYVEPGTLHH